MMGIIKEDGVMKRTRKFSVDYFKPQRVGSAYDGIKTPKQ